MKKQTIFALSAFAALYAQADDAFLKKHLTQLGATNIQISDSPLPNFKTAVTDQGVLQISENGKFIIQGEIYEVSEQGVVNITHKALLGELNKLEPEMIVYPAKNQKYMVTVFTDISCHYCQKLHTQLKEYNNLGITVRYLAFPRTGLKHELAKQMEAIWAEENRQFAIDQAFKGKLPQARKAVDVVRKHYELGVKFGVQGTPSMVTQDGTFLRGYLEPKDLLEVLGGN